MEKNTVLFDQRQCEISTPDAADPATDLSSNTTDHLIADVEQLRGHLEVDRWLVFGESWGSTLALAYAERYPQRVSAIVLAGVSSTRRREIRWLYHDISRLFLQQWARFHAGAPQAERDGDLVAAYYKLLNDADPAARDKAARDWREWEMSTVSVDPDYTPPACWFDPRFQYRLTRIVTHYFHHGPG